MHNTVEVITTTVGAICTLAIFSVLYRENRFYRLFEHLFIGVAAAFGLFVAWRDVLQGGWWEPLSKEGRWYWMIAPCLGAMFYTVYSRKYAWMSRLLIGTLLGIAAGQAFQGFVSQMWPQITSSFLPVIPRAAAGKGEGVTWPVALNNLLFIVILVCVMSYFFFSFRHERAPWVREPAKLGRWLLMIAFGATFGSTVMARFSLFIDRLIFLFRDWLHLIP